MKRLPYLLFFIFSCGNTAFASISKPPTQLVNLPQQQPHEYPNINVSPVFNINSQTSADSNQTNRQESRQDQKAAIATSVSSSLESFMKTIKEKVQQGVEKAQQGMEKAQEYAETIFSYCDRKKIIIASIIFVYGYTWYTMKKGSSLLSSPKAWSSWKYEKGFEKILVIPHKEISHELLIEIQKRYFDPTHPRDMITPLTKFSQDVECELAKLQSFLSWAQILKGMYLHKILPFGPPDIEKAKEKLNRLNYFKNIFITWAAEQKAIPFTSSISLGG